MKNIQRMMLVLGLIAGSLQAKNMPTTNPNVVAFVQDQAVVDGIKVIINYVNSLAQTDPAFKAGPYANLLGAVSDGKTPLSSDDAQFLLQSGQFVQVVSLAAATATKETPSILRGINLDDLFATAEISAQYRDAFLNFAQSTTPATATPATATPATTPTATTPAEVTPSQEEVANAQAEAAKKAIEVAQNALNQAIAPIKAAEAALKNATKERDTAERNLQNNQNAQATQNKVSAALRRQRKNKQADEADAAASKKVAAAQKNLDSKKAELEKQTKNLAAVTKQQQPVIENAQKEVAAAQDDYKKYSSQRAALQ